MPVAWRTLIERWEPDSSFVDTQLKGPYKKWLHTHTFEDLGGGTLMTDRVVYRLPLGRLGKALAGSFVRGDIEKIFAYRQEAAPKLIAQGALR